VIKINCPACAGPDNTGCATCHGESQVAQEVFDAFMAEKTKQEEAQTFWGRVQEHMYQTGRFKFEANEKVFELDN
jgi:hypothetical protein